ncbi:MAG: hypothetical protein ACRDQ5_18060, partial [Sciscionella sp.]
YSFCSTWRKRVDDMNNSEQVHRLNGLSRTCDMSGCPPSFSWLFYRVGRVLFETRTARGTVGIYAWQSGHPPLF